MRAFEGRGGKNKSRGVKPKRERERECVCVCERERERETLLGNKVHNRGSWARLKLVGLTRADIFFYFLCQVSGSTSKEEISKMQQAPEDEL